MRTLTRFAFLPILCAMAIASTSCNKEEETKEESNGGSNGGGNGASDITVSGNVGGHDYVDLGLPSGTKWATCNVGATKPEAYGDYFAWGETLPNKRNGKWHHASYTELQAQGVIDGVRSVKVDDGVGNLTAEYDAATANWGNNWRMPTIDEMIELYSLQNEEGELNGIKGRIFKGINGNYLFLPFAGLRDQGKLYDVGEMGFYWSATVGEMGYKAYNMMMRSEKVYWKDNHDEYNLYTVRPVLKTK